jgi:hypothetical protein
MFTSIDKALAALAMAVLSLLSLLFGVDVGINGDTIAMIASIVTPAIVWAVPNRDD